jgi:hypothetical protein
MYAIPARDLTPLEPAIQAFNSGADPTAPALQPAFLDANVNVLAL